MARFHQLSAVGFLLLGVQVAAGCNTVLGIEQAELVENTNSLSCHWPPAEPTKDCPVCDESCADSCKIGECLADRDCRRSLKDYRKCVGDACTDTSGECRGCVSGNARAAELTSCMKDCRCSVAGAVTLCESYCACMQSQCSDNQPGGSSGCLEACSKGLAGAKLPLNDPSVDAIWQTKPADWEV